VLQSGKRNVKSLNKPIIRSIKFKNTFLAIWPDKLVSEG